MANVNGLVGMVGIAKEGQTLTVRTTGISDADGLGIFSYQWQRDGVNITSTTNH